MFVDDLPRTIAVKGILSLNCSESVTLSYLLVRLNLRYFIRLPKINDGGIYNAIAHVIFKDSRELKAGLHKFDLEFAVPQDSFGYWNHRFGPDIRYRVLTYCSITVETISKGINISQELPHPPGPSAQPLWAQAALSPASEPKWGSKHGDYPAIILCPPGYPGDIPPDLDWTFEEYVDGFGAIRLTARAPCLRISAPVAFRFEVVDPPHDRIRIIKVIGEVIQHQTYNSPNKPAKKHPTWQSTGSNVFLTLDSHLPVSLQKGQSEAFQTCARLSHDWFLIPTTLPGTKTPWTISHELQIRITFIHIDGREREIKIAKSITLAACMLLFEDILLPTYSAEPEQLQTREEFQPERPTDPIACLCGVKFASEQVSDIQKSVSIEDSSSMGHVQETSKHV